MLISFGNRGQFGNAFLASAYLIAHAIENRYSIRVYNLAPFSDRLAKVAGNREIVLRSSKLIHRLGSGVGWVLNRFGLPKHLGFGPFHIVCDDGLSVEELAAKARSSLVVHFGWGFRDRESLRKHVDVVRNALRFSEGLVASCAKEFEMLTRGSEYSIGVHVRLGDYRHYRGGRFFFSASVYQSLVAQAVEASRVPPDRVVVLVFSNEKLDWPERIAGASVRAPEGNWWQDFLILSMCDVILGPPSTFSGGASFLGSTPLFQIRNAEQSFDQSLALTYLATGIRIQ